MAILTKQQLIDKKIMMAIDFKKMANILATQWSKSPKMGS
jgi:hypothetical protein